MSLEILYWVTPLFYRLHFPTSLHTGNFALDAKHSDYILKHSFYNHLNIYRIHLALWPVLTVSPVWAPGVGLHSFCTSGMLPSSSPYFELFVLNPGRLLGLVLVLSSCCSQNPALICFVSLHLEITILRCLCLKSENLHIFLLFFPLCVHAVLFYFQFLYFWGGVSLGWKDMSGSDRR